MFLQYERLENIPEVGIMVDQGDGEMEREDKVCTQITGSDLTEPGHLGYLEYLQNNRTASFRNMALSHSDTLITYYSSAINARLILCTTRGIYNSQFGLIIQSLTCVYDGPLMEGGIGGGWNCQR